MKSATQPTVRSSWPHREKRWKTCSQLRYNPAEENKSTALVGWYCMQPGCETPYGLVLLFSRKLGNSCYPFSHTLQWINRFKLLIGFTFWCEADILTDIKVFPLVWCSLSKQMVGCYCVSAIPSTVKNFSWSNHSLVTKNKFLKKEKWPALNIFLAWYLRMKQVMDSWQLPGLLMWTLYTQSGPQQQLGKHHPRQCWTGWRRLPVRQGSKLGTHYFAAPKRKVCPARQVGSPTFCFSSIQLSLFQFSSNSTHNNIPNLKENLPETINFRLFAACKSALAQGCVLSQSQPWLAQSKFAEGFLSGSFFEV